MGLFIIGTLIKEIRLDILLPEWEEGGTDLERGGVRVAHKVGITLASPSRRPRILPLLISMMPFELVVQVTFDATLALWPSL